MRRLEEDLHPEEPWFTLRGKDLLAPAAVRVWADACRAAAAGLEEGSGIAMGEAGPSWKAREMIEALRAEASNAEQIAAQMISWQSRHPELAGLPG